MVLLGMNDTLGMSEFEIRKDSIYNFLFRILALQKKNEAANSELSEKFGRQAE